MKNLLLLSALFVSLAANGWLLLRPGGALARESNPTATDRAAANARPGSAVGSSTAATTREAAAPRPLVWTAPGSSPAELRAFAADLRAAGVPDRIAVQLVGTLVRERHLAPLAALPHWKLLQMDVATRRQMNAAGVAAARELEELLGPIASPAALLDPVQRRLEYGDLPDAKVNALTRIEQDYRDLSLEFSAPRGILTATDVAARQKQMDALEQERLADIAAALTPEEFADWERRSSSNATRVQYGLRNTTVTAEEYEALYTIQKQFEPNAGGNSLMIGRDRPGAEIDAMHAQVRGVLGDERFDSYLKTIDFQYSEVASYAAKQGNLTSAQTYALYQLQRDAMSAMRVRPDSPAPSMDERRKLFADLNGKLDALLGPAGADAYRKQGTGTLFNNFRTPPRPAAPANPALPAVPASPTKG